MHAGAMQPAHAGKWAGTCSPFGLAGSKQASNTLLRTPLLLGKARTRSSAAPQPDRRQQVAPLGGGGPQWQPGRQQRLQGQQQEQTWQQHVEKRQLQASSAGQPQQQRQRQPGQQWQPPSPQAQPRAPQRPPDQRQPTPDRLQQQQPSDHQRRQQPQRWPPPPPQQQQQRPQDQPRQQQQPQQQSRQQPQPQQPQPQHRTRQQQQPQPHQTQQQTRQQQHRQQPQQQRRQQPQGGPSTAPAGGAGYLVVVEGVNDMRAVRRAVPGAPVYVLGTSTAAGSQQLLQDLAAAAAHFRGVIVLTDPDVAGRQARRLLDEGLPGCLHAFLPSPLAIAAAATRNHEEGNVGIEHAAAEHIRAALAAPRRSDPQRQAFDREQLLSWGLVADLHARGGSVTRRRHLVCSFLGLGDCDGKQLLRQLNRYCFTQEEVQRAMQWAEGQLQQEGEEGEAAAGAGPAGQRSL